MSKLRRHAAMLLVFGACAVPVAFADEETQAKTRAVTLADLRRAPDSYRGIPCEFVVVFHEFSQVYNPYFTRFIPETHANFSAWGDEQEIWDLRQYDNDCAFLFVSKLNPELSAFLKLQRFDRIKVVGTILDTFKGKPWIEVHSMTPVPGKITVRSLKHRVRGDIAMRKNRPRIAAKEYHVALAEPGLPPAYAFSLTRSLAMALYRGHDFVGAHEVFARLATMKPGDPHVKALTAQSAARARESAQENAAMGYVIEEPLPEPGAKPKPSTPPAPR